MLRLSLLLLLLLALNILCQLLLPRHCKQQLQQHQVTAAAPLVFGAVPSQHGHLLQQVLTGC